MHLADLHNDNIDKAFAADVESLVQSGDMAGLSKRCEEAIHTHLTLEEEQHEKEHAELK